jgi:hypothetical protein
MDNKNKSRSDNGWTAKREVTLSKWKETCKQYLEFHQTEHAAHAGKIRRMLIFNLLLSGMAIIFNGFVFLNDVTFVVGNICAAVINAVLAGTHVYQKFEGSETKLSLHSSAMKVYKRLHHNMEKEFAQPHGERLDCKVFMKNVSMLLLDYEDDFEQPLLSLTISSASASASASSASAVAPKSKEEESFGSASISASAILPTLNENQRSFDSTKSETADWTSVAIRNASPSLVNNPDVSFSRQSNQSDEDDEKKILGFTEDQNERFGMFIRRASDREHHMRNYQLKRLGAK